jgi:hypothetical protein
MPMWCVAPLEMKKRNSLGARVQSAYRLQCRKSLTCELLSLSNARKLRDMQCQVSFHTMKAYRGIVIIDPLILSSDTGVRWVTNFTPGHSPSETEARSFILQSVLRQVHSFFQSEFSTVCDLLLPFSRSSSSFLHLLPRLPATSNHPSIFPSITCFSRQFLRKINHSN